MALTYKPASSAIFSIRATPSFPSFTAANKSLHVWCSTRGLSEEQINQKIVYTNALGVDTHGMTLSQFMRLPNPTHPSRPNLFCISTPSLSIMSNNEIPANFRTKHEIATRALALAQRKLQDAQQNFEANPDKDYYRRQARSAETKVMEEENKLHEVSQKIEEYRSKTQTAEEKENELFNSLMEHMGDSLIALVVKYGTKTSVAWPRLARLFLGCRAGLRLR
jgi:hypothetical protein